MWTAMHAEDPTFVLIPKHLLWAEHESKEPVRAVPLGVARKRNAGSDVTVVAWGNTIEKSLEALEQIGGEISVDLLDLRSIVPWDKAAVEESVRRTGRLSSSRGHRELQRRPDDHHARGVAERHLERAR
jgi:2-oxoisovalerate dehydrogenase E1 component